MILIELAVPSMDQTFDFQVDENALVEQVMGEICEMLSKKMKESLTEMEDPFILCSLDQEGVLDRFSTLADAGVKDGSRLMLV